MTNVCPQCKFPVPREGSRFCNQCGADLRALGSSSPTAIEMAETLDEAISPVSAAAQVFSERLSPPPLPEIPAQTTMTVSQDTKSPKPSQPEATLHILARDGSVTERDLKTPETRIGKGPQNDIILPDASVSATHAMISLADGVFTLTDLGSRNGTFLNDARVSEPRKLQHGDLIKMGHCTLTFRLNEAETTLSIPRTLLLDQTPPPPAPPPAPKTPAMTEESLAQALVASGLVAQSEVNRLRSAGASMPGGRRLGRALIEENLITEIGLRDLMSRTFNIPPVELKTMDVDAAMAIKLRVDFLRARVICPVIGPQPDRLMLAVADPTDSATIEEVERITGKKASLRLAKASEIVAQVDSYFTPRLIGVLPTGEKVEALLNQSEIEIGKAPHNKVVIPDLTVSSTHAVVLVRDGGYSIVDLGSSNGTFVNGTQLGNEARTLQHGDKIQFGNVVLTFRNPAETTENKTARLSLEALEEVRRRASLRTDPQAVVRADQAAWAAPHGVPPSRVVTAAEDDEVEKSEKKKKKNKDKNSWFSPNSVSRILAQVLGAAVSLFGSYYLVKSGLKNVDDNSGAGSHNRATAVKFVPSTSWASLPGGKFETSSVAQVPGSDLVLMVDDGRPGEVLMMKIDQNGEPVGGLRSLSLGVTIQDPEGITTDGSSFYIVGSQSDPQWGQLNAIARFSFDPQTQSLRGQPEVISDFRSFLLNSVPELKGVGDAPGAQGGLNIEGLGWDKLHDRLVLGLRSPVIGGQAVLVPMRLRDPRGAFTTSNLQFENPRVIFLPLGGQGVRDIAYDAHLRSFLIISGAPENAEKSDFKLWEWDGEALSTKTREEMTLDAKFKPEGLTQATINGRPFLFLVGDASSYLKLDYSDVK